jgi:hypothetical protein
MEQIVAGWWHPVASNMALDIIHRAMPHELLQCLAWPSKWSAMEVHLFVATAFFV